MAVGGSQGTKFGRGGAHAVFEFVEGFLDDRAHLRGWVGCFVEGEAGVDGEHRNYGHIFAPFEIL